MCLIKFWIINIASKTVLHEREFPVNLVRSKKLGYNGDLSNVKLRDKTTFVNSVFMALGLESEKRSQGSNETDWENSLQKDQLEYYDFSANNRLPVIDLHLDETYSIWPLIIIEQNKHLFCGLPLVFNKSKDLIDHLSISTGFSTLKSIINAFTKESRSNLELFISNYLPFGQLISFPIDLSRSTSLSSKNKKQEAIVFLKISELISSSSRDKELIYGSVLIENNRALGENSKMMLNIKNLDQLNLVLSPFCTRCNDSALQIRLNQPGAKSIHFLCDNKLFRPFIVYDYTITRSSTQRLLYKINIQINVNIALNSNFIFFNVVFTNCFGDKSARVLNSTPNWGQLSLEKGGLTWFIGNKLPKNQCLKMSLDVVCMSSDMSFTDANLSFKSEQFNYAFPKLSIDNIHILDANQKTKFLTEITFGTVNYKLQPNIE